MGDLHVRAKPVGSAQPDVHVYWHTHRWPRWAGVRLHEAVAVEAAGHVGAAGGLAVGGEGGGRLAVGGEGGGDAGCGGDGGDGAKV